MMRHSKGQCKKNSSEAIVRMPPKVEATVLVSLNDASEQFLYGCLERLSRREMAKTNGHCSCLNRGHWNFECSCLYRRHELVLTSRELQLVACHPCTLDLDALEAKLAADDARQAVAANVAGSGGGGGGGGRGGSGGGGSGGGGSGGGGSGRGGSGRGKGKATGKQSTARAEGSAGGSAADAVASTDTSADGSRRRLLRDVVSEWDSAGDARAARAENLLTSSSRARCILCQAPFATMTSPLAAGDVSMLATQPLLTGCSHLFCEPCLTQSVGALGAPDACPECKHPNPMHSATRLLTPLDAPSEAAAMAADSRSRRGDGSSRGRLESSAKEGAGEGSRMRRIESCAWSAQTCASAERLTELLVWRCAGAETHPAGRGAEQPVSIDLEHGGPGGPGVHFCGHGCAEAMLRRCLTKAHGKKSGYVVSDDWPGRAMRGKSYAAVQDATAQLWAAIESATPVRDGKLHSAWRGVPFYGGPAYPNRSPHSGVRVDDERFPRLSHYPVDAPAGAFLAHHDAAGGKRDYGLHWPYRIGSKLRAILDEIHRIRSGEADGDEIAEIAEAAGAQAAASAAETEADSRQASAPAAGAASGP